MLAALLLLATPALPIAQEAPATDPLTEARAGKVRCVAPDRAKRTCHSIVRYAVHADGSFDATVIGVVMDDVLLEYRAFGRVERGGVCTMVRTADFERGRLLRRGRPLGPGEQAIVWRQLRDAVQPLVGKKRCFRDGPPDGAGESTSVITLDGVAHPGMSQQVAWVSPGEGYAVGL